MKLKVMILVACGFVVLPSCMHPVESAMSKRTAARLAALEERGSVSMGAFDDVGQYTAAATLAGGARLTLDVEPQVTSALR
jgi:hypothetical protein